MLGRFFCRDARLAGTGPAHAATAHGLGPQGIATLYWWGGASLRAPRPTVLTAQRRCVGKTVHLGIPWVAGYS